MISLITALLSLYYAFTSAPMIKQYCPVLYFLAWQLRMVMLESEDTNCFYMPWMWYPPSTSIKAGKTNWYNILIRLAMKFYVEIFSEGNVQSEDWFVSLAGQLICTLLNEPKNRQVSYPAICHSSQRTAKGIYLLCLKPEIIVLQEAGDL